LVRQLLWLPTTREQKYKAKHAVDTFFVRFGDMLSAAFLILREHKRLKGIGAERQKASIIFEGRDTAGRAVSQSP